MHLFPCIKFRTFLLIVRNNMSNNHCSEFNYNKNVWLKNSYKWTNTFVEAFVLNKIQYFYNGSVQFEHNRLLKIFPLANLTDFTNSAMVHIHLNHKNSSAAWLLQCGGAPWRIRLKMTILNNFKHVVLWVTSILGYSVRISDSDRVLQVLSGFWNEIWAYYCVISY